MGGPSGPTRPAVYPRGPPKPENLGKTPRPLRKRFLFDRVDPTLTHLGESNLLSRLRVALSGWFLLGH
jgi:hypothetical protein